MVRNDEVPTAGAWAACIREDGNTVMYFRKCVFRDGLTALRLKQICEAMLGEVCAFDRKLDESRQELFNLRFQHATGALENPAALYRAKQSGKNLCVAA